MKLFERENQDQSTIERAVELMGMLGVQTSVDIVQEQFDDMSLTDIIDLSSAIESGDIEYLQELFGNGNQTDSLDGAAEPIDDNSDDEFLDEYSMPGRSGVQSAANHNNKQPSQTATQPTVNKNDNNPIDDPEEEDSIKPSSSDSTYGSKASMSPGQANWKQREEENELNDLKKLAGLIK